MRNEEVGLETEEGYENNHVALLDAFMVSLGASQEFCASPALELAPNLALLDDITGKVQHESINYAVGLRGMGAEFLCQVYLTAIFDLSEQNPHFLARKDELDLRFEQLHRGPVEAEHRIQMRDWIAELSMRDIESLEELKAGYEYGRRSFHTFFDNIYDYIDSIEMPTFDGNGAQPPEKRLGQPSGLEVGKPRLHTDIRRKEGVLVAAAGGRIDGVTSGAFEEQVMAEIGDGDKAVILDLENLTYISSAGMRVVLIVGKHLWKSDRQLVLCSLTERVAEIVEMMNFDKLFPICGSQAEALRKVK